MKDYLAYSVEDFVTDESYLRYYHKENEEDVSFWADWIGRHPEKLDVVISANNYIEAFSIRLSDDDFQIEQQRFADALKSLSEDSGPLYLADEEDELAEKRSEPAFIFHQKSIVLKIIAMLIVLVMLAGVYFLFS